MAGNNDQVKYTDLFDSDITSGLNALKTALEEVVKQIAALKAEAQALKKALGNANTATREQQQTTAADAAEAERLSRQIKELTTEEARLKAAIAEANRMTKLQGQAANAAEGSLNQMRARYKLLVAEMSNYNLKTEEGRRKMQATAAQARKLRDEIYKLEASYGQFGRNVGNYTGALSRFGARLKEAAARFVAFNATFLSATGLIRFGKALFEVRKELESTLVTYKALAGEIQGAKLFEEVKNFALTTPVTLNAASKAVQTMLSFGVAQDKVVDIMKRLGDISSADSERMQRLALAYSQATQAGRLMGQDTLQFINAGFNPLYYISLRTGESMEYLRDQMKKGKIDISQVTQAIIDATSEGGQFNGMLEKQRDTMKGAAAIMEGAWQNMLNEMGQDMESGIVGIIKWLTKLMQNWRETIRTMRQIAVSIGTAKVALLILEKTMWKVTASTEAATNATNKFGLALKRIPVFLAVSVFTMLVQKLIDTNREMNRLKDYTKEFADVETEMNKEMKKEISRLDQLFAELRKAKKGTAEYKAAQQAIIDGFGKYDETLSKELSDVNNLKTAYDKLTTSIQNSYKTKARQSFMEKSETRLGESEAKLRQELNEFVEDYTDENGNWSTKRLKGGALPRAIYNNVQHYLQYGKWLDGQVASQIINGRLGWGNGDLGRAALQYQTALRAFKEANQRADALWGPYVEPTETGYTPVTTGGGGDNKNKRRASGSFNKTYRGLTMADILVEEANAMRDKGGDVLAEIQLWYDKKVSIANAAYIKEKETLERERDERNKSLTDNINKAKIFKSKYDEIVAEVDKDPYLDDEGKKARKDELANQLKEATALIDSESVQRANIKKYYDEKEIIAEQKKNNELADLEEQRTEKLFKEEQKRFNAYQDAEKRRFELEKHNSIERAKFDMEQEIASKQWQIDHAKELELSEAELAILKEEVEWLNKKYNQGNYNAKRGNTGNYSNIMDVLFGEKITNDQISALNSVFDQAKEALNSWMDARKAAADQAKELADDEVSAAENALNREIELRNQGYANDVALREKELADAKEQQKKALEMQQKAKEEELAINTALEASNMAVAIANLIKQFGWWSIPMIGVMLGAWGAAKASAFSQIRSTKYREGGVMLLEGGSHESGHDVNLGIGPDGSNLRAEGGEYFAVINKRNSRKYGSEIPAVVNALNSGMFEDRYIKTSDAMGLMGNVGVVGNVGESADLSRLEGGVDALVKQGESRWSTEGEWRVMRYKNLTRRVRVS